MDMTEDHDHELCIEAMEAMELQEEHDRLMNERARLILDGVDPAELAMPLPPSAGSAS